MDVEERACAPSAGYASWGRIWIALSLESAPRMGAASSTSANIYASPSRTRPARRRPDARNPYAIYPVVQKERHINLIVAAGSRVKLGLRYESGRAPKDTAGRFRVLSMQGTEVLGGGNLLVRH
jgi:hypothetical protein